MSTYRPPVPDVPSYTPNTPQSPWPGPTLPGVPAPGTEQHPPLITPKRDR